MTGFEVDLMISLILTDFIIGAYASQMEGQKIVTSDKGYHSTYFPELNIISAAAKLEPHPKPPTSIAPAFDYCINSRSYVSIRG